jgi:hypothetical protein
MKDIPELKGREELAAWIKKNLDKAVNELGRTGRAEDFLVEAKPAWVYPFQILIGKMRMHSLPDDFMWFICGDAPTDCIVGSSADSPRAAARYFSLKWQLDASASGTTDEALSARAEALYELVEEERLWKQEQ